VTLPPRSWLSLAPAISGDLVIYRTRLHDRSRTDSSPNEPSSPGF
jgi:hypothetical protein